MAEHQGPRPLNRRDLLAGAGTGILAIYLVGCGGSSSKLPVTTGGTAPATTGGGATTAGDATGVGVPGPPAEGGTPGGKLVAVWQAEGNSNDPAIGYTGTSWDSICNLTYAPLYTYSENNDPQPQCAADLPHISSNGLTYTIPLRDGVTFHNGRPVVAEDYAYAWDRVLDPANESWAASYIYTIQGAKERYEDGAKTVTGIKVVNPKTIQITLTQPDVTFLYALTQPFMAPVPKEEVEKYGKDFQAHVVGNGPYKLTSYDPGGQTMLFDRHTEYHWPGLPYVDQVEYRWGVDPGVQILELSKAEADVLPDGLDAQNLAKMRRDAKLKDQIIEQPLFAQRWVNLDQSRQPLFKDKRIREALNWATDRDALSRVTGDTAFTFGAPFPKDLPGFPRTFQPYTYDPEKAKALLAEAGVSKPTFDFWLSSDSSDETKLGQILQQQWAAVGINAKIRGEANADALYQLTIDNKCDAWFSLYYAIYPTMIDLISQYYETDGSSNYTHYTNPQVDELTAKARQTTDQVARDTLLAEVEQIVGDDAVHVFLQTANWLMGVDLTKVQNFHYSGVYGPYYDRLWLA
jgi:peptide/nickel transport system substrate-binding protein